MRLSSPACTRSSAIGRARIAWRDGGCLAVRLSQVAQRRGRTQPGTPRRPGRGGRGRRRLVGRRRGSGTSPSALRQALPGPRPPPGWFEPGIEREEFILLPNRPRPRLPARSSPAPPRGAEYLALRRDWVRTDVRHRTGPAAPGGRAGESMRARHPGWRHPLRRHHGAQFRAFGVYVLEIAGERLVKRVQPKLDGSLTLISDNQAYEADHIPACPGQRRPRRRARPVDLRTVCGHRLSLRGFELSHELLSGENRAIMRHGKPARPSAQLGGKSARNPFDVLPGVRLHVGRHGHRPRHRQHAGLRQGPGNRARRTLRGCHRRCARQEAGRRGGRGGQAHAGPHARLHHRKPAAARWRDRRFRGRGGDAQALHPQGEQPPPPAREWSSSASRPGPPRSSAVPSGKVPRPPARGVSCSSRSRWRQRSAPVCRSPSRPVR